MRPPNDGGLPLGKGVGRPEEDMRPPNDRGWPVEDRVVRPEEDVWPANNEGCPPEEEEEVGRPEELLSTLVDMVVTPEEVSWFSGTTSALTGVDADTGTPILG